MQPFLLGANPLFIEFIEKGLAEMERLDDKKPTAATMAASTASTAAVLGEAGQSTGGSGSSNNNKDSDYWMDRLKYMLVCGHV